MYLLKPQSTELKDVIITSLNGTPVEFTVEKLKHWQSLITIGDRTFDVRHGMVELAFQVGTYLKLDPQASKIRQISPEKVAALTTRRNIKMSFEDGEVNPEEYGEINLDIAPTFLKDIQWDPKMFTPLKTGTFLDDFASTKGGWQPATNIMITGDPGIGKSSNMIEILTKIKELDPTKKVAYISAEMEAEDFEEFLQFYPGLESIPILFLGEYLHEDKYPIWQVVQSFLNPGYDIVVLDSMIEIQMMIQEELNLPQKKGEAHMLKLMRRHNKGFNENKSYTCFLCIQQKNKSGQYVGSKRLEHMTTAFLQLLWDPKEKGKRYMVFEKNRKGSVKHRLYYSFGPGGIVYDSKRFQQEKELLELTGITGSDAEAIAELSLSEFSKMFSEPKKDITD
jgi:hypothetical protein